MLFYLALFFCIYFGGQAFGLGIWWGHLIAALFAIWHLHYLSKYYIFWLLVLIAFCFSSEPRFSIEHLLLASGFLGIAFNPRWLKSERKTIFLFWFFLFVWLADLLKLNLGERGSLLLWFPIFLGLQASSGAWLYPCAAVLSFFSNKKTILLAYLALLTSKIKIKYLIFVAVILCMASFMLRGNIRHFYKTSFESRIYIMEASLKGFLHKPLFGHGFGTFIIDFPPYRSHSGAYGAKSLQQISHGHGLLPHFLFEQGVIGLILVLVIGLLIYQIAPGSLLAFIVVSLCDAPLVSPAQYLLMALILSMGDFQACNPKQIFLIFKTIPSSMQKISQVLITLLALVIFTASIVGHYYYDHKKFVEALKWDPYHSLYHFMYGAEMINQDTKIAEKHLERAVELSPSVSYFYGFLAATKLANGEYKEAQQSIEKALEMDGKDGYWHAIKAFSYYTENPEIYKTQYAQAIKLNPEIDFLIHDPSISAAEYIGSRKSDPRLLAFYRRGSRVYLPLPYL